MRASGFLLFLECGYAWKCVLGQLTAIPKDSCKNGAKMNVSEWGSPEPSWITPDPRGWDGALFAKALNKVLEGGVCMLTGKEGHLTEMSSHWQYPEGTSRPKPFWNSSNHQCTFSSQKSWLTQAPDYKRIISFLLEFSSRLWPWKIL